MLMVVVLAALDSTLTGFMSRNLSISISRETILSVITLKGRLDGASYASLLRRNEIIQQDNEVNRNNLKTVRIDITCLL